MEKGSNTTCKGKYIIQENLKMDYTGDKGLSMINKQEIWRMRANLRNSNIMGTGKSTKEMVN